MTAQKHVTNNDGYRHNITMYEDRNACNGVQKQQNQKTLERAVASNLQQYG